MVHNSVRKWKHSLSPSQISFEFVIILTLKKIRRSLLDLHNRSWCCNCRHNWICTHNFKVEASLYLTLVSSLLMTWVGFGGPTPRGGGVRREESPRRRCARLAETGDTGSPHTCAQSPTLGMMEKHGHGDQISCFLLNKNLQGNI